MLFSQLVGVHGDRDGSGDASLRQGQATSRAGLAQRPDSLSPSSERVLLPYRETGLAQHSASDLEAEATSKNLAAGPPVAGSVCRLLPCGGSEEAPE